MGIPLHFTVNTKETPFILTYDTDVVIPVKVGEPSARRTQFEEEINDENLALELDMIDEVRDHAQNQEEACKRRATRKHKSKLKRRDFCEVKRHVCLKTNQNP